jgi:hypothetical protein
MAKIELGLMFSIERDGNVAVEFNGQKWAAKHGLMTVNFQGDIWRVPMPRGTTCREAAAAFYKMLDKNYAGFEAGEAFEVPKGEN